MNKDIRPDKTSPAYLKKTKSGGLLAGFLYVLLFMSILGLGIWQSFESSYTESKIKTNYSHCIEHICLCNIKLSIYFV